MPTTTYKSLMERMFFERGFSAANSAKNAAYKQEKERHAQADAMGLVHRGGGYYAKDDKTPITHKGEDNKIVALTPDEKKQANKSSSSKKSSVGAPSNKIAPDKVVPSKVAGKTPQEFTKDDFSNAMQDRLTMSMAKFNTSASALAVKDQFASDFRRFYGRLTNISKMPRGAKRRAELEDLIGNFNIMMGNKKLYANHFTKSVGLYKVFGETLGKDAQFFLNMCDEEGIDLNQSTDKKESAKQYLAGQSKPNYGKPHRYDDPNVRELFTSNPVLDDLEPRYKSVFGPSDENGQLMRSGGKNAKAFFEHSVKSNVGVDRTIKELESFAEKTGQKPDDVIGYAGVANALKQYRKNMQMSLKRFDTLQPKARAELVGQIYAKLAHDMHMADADTAGSIMKNMAEMALYDTELARGDEAYLPSEGTFPTGDKIVVSRKGTKVERIETISVKYGKNSARSYGMPGEAAKVCLYHPNPKMRDILDSRAGRAGYEVGVNGTVIHDESNFRNFARMSGFDKCFSKDELEQIRKLGVEMTLITKKFKQNHPRSKKSGELPAEELGGLENDPAMQKSWVKLNKILQGGNQEKLQQLLGDYNYRQMLKPGKNSMSFYSMLGFGAALSTSDGFPTVLHNHQEYRDGKFISETDVGTNQLRDWQTMFIPYGKRAGGLKVGFNRHGNEVAPRKKRTA